MNRDKILKKLIELLTRKHGVSEETIISDNYNKPLTGKDFNFDGVSLTYLFFDIQKEFSIHINAEQILNYEFNTINSIADLIGKYSNQEVA